MDTTATIVEQDTDEPIVLYQQASVSTVVEMGNEYPAFGSGAGGAQFPSVDSISILGMESVSAGFGEDDNMEATIPTDSESSSPPPQGPGAFPHLMLPMYVDEEHFNAMGCCAYCCLGFVSIVSMVGMVLLGLEYM